jgi:hypothetical protein
VRKPRAETEVEEYFEDPPAEPLTGGPPATEDDSELAGVLGDMCCGALKLGMLLAEADEDRWGSVAERLRLFRSLVDQLPVAPRPRRRVGFRVRVRRRRT